MNGRSAAGCYGTLISLAHLALCAVAIFFRAVLEQSERVLWADALMLHIGPKTPSCGPNLFDKFFVSPASHCRHRKFVALPAPAVRQTRILD